MSFFLRLNQKQGKNINIIKLNINQIKNVTLQVRIPRTKKDSCGKRTFPSIFLNRSGSMTVEASLVLPLFLFAMVIMTMPCSMMNRQRQVQAVVESVCEELCQAAYVGYELKEKKTEMKLPEEGLELEFEADGLEGAAMMAYAQAQVRRKLGETRVRKLSLAKSEFMEDGETVNLVASYEMALPFPVFRLSAVPMTSKSCRRAWIGKDGGWLESGTGEDDDEIVYVGKNSARYHESRTCHYLYNQLTGVARAEVDSLRNADGKKYHPCAVCGGGTGGQVFIMQSGTSYHSSSSCTAIIAYVKAVRKSEVAHLGACSYCSGG